LDFTKSDANPNLYLVQVGKDRLILVLYVDDLFLTEAEKLINRGKKELEVWKQLGEIFLRQGKYAVEIQRRRIRWGLYIPIWWISRCTRS
jgi:hypothetical protein